MADRSKEILELLSMHKRMEVAALAEELDVSQVTMRKDLDRLESRGIIRREHGMALIGSSDDINNRLAYHYEIKQRIAALAASKIHNGDTIMIESGSCCALLAEELARERRDITIITNSAFIAGHIRRLPGAKLILLGGDFQCESQVMVGPITRLCIQNFYVDKLFIGADGFRANSGFTGSDHMRTETVRNMAEHAEKLIVLTESSKFALSGIVSLAPIESVSAVYTDEGIPGDIEKLLINNNIELHKIAAN